VYRGFSGGEHKVATINGYPFSEGEEAEISVPGGRRTKVRCIEIKGETVVIEVGGERRELRLGEK
jgi:hypothetical protein